jgi:hypothetical protein
MASVQFIFARGTGESGNVGTDVGAPLIANLRAALGTANIAAQGVDYAADVLGTFCLVIGIQIYTPTIGNRLS